MRLSLLLGAFALGCNASTTDDTDTDEPVGDVVQSGDCDVAAPDWRAVTNFRTLSVQGEGYLLDETFARVIASSEVLAELQETYEMVIEPVDFSEEVILVASVGASSTCGFSDEELLVLSNIDAQDGPSNPNEPVGIHMSLSATDTTGACDEVCDMSWADIRAIAVTGPMNSGPVDYTVCAQLAKTCN